MASVDSEDAASEANDLILHSYLLLVGMIVLYYDQILTTLDEINCIWTRPRSISAILFLLNRWLAFVGNIPILVITFTETGINCNKYYLSRQVLLLFNECLVGWLCALRMYALYRRSRRVLVFLILVAVVLVSLAAWSITGQTNLVAPPVYPGCHVGDSSETGIHLAIAWELLFVFDATIFVLTVSATYKEHRRLQGLMSTSRQPHLLTLLFRDGAMYFGIMALSNLSNILTYYLTSLYLKGAMSTFATNLAVTMMSRLMLNLHKSAPVEGIMTSGSTEPGPRLPNAIFTTRLGWSGVEPSRRSGSEEPPEPGGTGPDARGVEGLRQIPELEEIAAEPRTGVSV
ncbi:hypothetical protein PLICRDRAFT_91645 [Plicaturopsis crispa FD-325 SS-3]|nr:hypothetical protein PLICRDRAFT_91645 [Plicaturopsis crispa FD-325 SS-3]